MDDRTHEREIRSSDYGHIPTCSCGWPGRMNILRYKSWQEADDAWSRHVIRETT
jgi:hypothetical protein